MARSGSEPNSGVVRILGVDPGLRLTGYGVIDFHPVRQAGLVDAGVIRLDGKTAIPSRLVELERELTELLQEHRPEVVAVEMLFSNYAHPRTAILMAHARGVILLCARRSGARIEQIAPRRVKQSLTGYGATSKGGMQQAVQQYWKLPELPKPPDVADALAIALACGRSLSNPERS